MEGCLQTCGVNMLQHGQAVHSEYKALICELNTPAGLYRDTLQPIYAKLKTHLPPAEVLRDYHIFHDCSKHLCLTIDEEGNRRYPNHAEVSAQQYALLFPEDGFTKQLISMDMGFHTYRGEELDKLCESPFAPILYFTAWAEINANAEMFGGRNSESYKIKRSRLIKAGKKLLQAQGG